jgi:hypothetical protein
MRLPVDALRLGQFMRAFGAEASQPVRAYLTGGATAVVLGWRTSTLDIDLELVPEDDRLLRAIPSLKESLQINVELASPAHFIPELPGWQDRSRFITQEAVTSFYHYDFYAQALSKIERGHAQDLKDVNTLLHTGLIESTRLRELFEAIFPSLYRFPAIDPDSFRRALEAILPEPRD